MHPIGEEHATLLGFFVASEGRVALFLKALERLACVVVGFLFAVGKEATVLSGVARNVPAHLAASVKGTESTARDQDVELALVHVATDVGDHDDELLALDGLVVHVGRILTRSLEGELEALAAVAAVGGRHRREGESHVGTTVDGERNMARAGRLATAGADAAATASGILTPGIAGLGKVAGILRPGAVRSAAIPVAGCPAGTAGATPGLDVRALGVVVDARRRLGAGAGLFARRRLGAGRRLSAGTRLFILVYAGGRLVFGAGSGLNFGRALLQNGFARSGKRGFAGNRNVRFDKDVARKVRDHAVGVDDGAFRGDDRLFVQVNIGGNNRAGHVDDAFVCGIEETDLRTGDIGNDIGVSLRDDHVRDVALDEPTLHEYGFFCLLPFLGGGFSGGFLGTVPSEEEDAD